jgi:hypothetical protein
MRQAQQVTRLGDGHSGVGVQGVDEVAGRQRGAGGQRGANAVMMEYRNPTQSTLYIPLETSSR